MEYPATSLALPVCQVPCDLNYSHKVMWDMDMPAPCVAVIHLKRSVWKVFPSP